MARWKNSGPCGFWRLSGFELDVFEQLRRGRVRLDEVFLPVVQEEVLPGAAAADGADALEQVVVAGGGEVLAGLQEFVLDDEEAHVV